MSNKNSIKPLHGLGWLIRTTAGVVLADKASGDLISLPIQLGEGRFELHWHRDASHAKSFEKGISMAGRNSVTASLGLGAVSQAVIVHFADEEAANCDELNEAVKLVLHSDANQRQGEIEWSTEVGDIIQLHTPNKHRFASAPPIRILLETPDVLKLEVKYANWWLKENTWNPLLTGGWYRVDITRSASGLIGSFDLNFETLRGYDVISEDSKQQMLSVAVEVGGTITNSHIVLPIGDDIGESLKELHPVLQALSSTLCAGLHDIKIAELRANKANQRVGKIISEGGSLQNENRKWFLVDKNGKKSAITEGRIHSAVQAGLIENPFLTIDISEIKI